MARLETLETVEPARTTRQVLGRSASALLVALAAAAMVMLSLTGCGAPPEKSPKVSTIAANLDRYAGRQVILTLRYGERPGASDVVPPLFTRSDAYLYDETGTILVTGAWQAHSRWAQDGTYQSASIKITAGGVWTITGRVQAAPGNMPYLQVAP